MFFRLFILITVTTQIMLFAPGCEQVKEYRKKVYYEKALELYESQQYGAAIDQTNRALAFDEDYIDALELQGMCQYAMKDFSKAGGVFRAAILLDDSRDDLAYLAADSFFKVQKFGSSKQFTDIILAKDPGNTQARYLNVRASLRSRILRLWAPTDTMLQPLFDVNEYREVAFALLAEFNILNSNLEMAELILTEHVDANDDWFFVMRVLAKKYDSLNDQQAAVRIYKQILELKPDSTQDIEQLLLILRNSGRKEEERQLFDSLIAADDQQVRYKLGLIDFFMHYGQLQDAEEYARAGLDQETDAFDFSQRLIEVYEKTNRLPEAIQLAKHVFGKLEKEREEREQGEEGEAEKIDLRIRFMNILARLYFLSNNLDVAKFVVHWILDIDSDNEQARFLLARISLDEGRTLLAIAELRALSSADTNNPEYDYYMGLAHMDRNEANNAEQSFKDALKKDALYKPALLEILEIYLERGFLSDVEYLIDDFLATNPNDPDILAFKAQLASKLVVVPEDG